MNDIEVLDTPAAEVGEAPMWDARRDCLWWVDIPAGRVHQTRLDTGRTRTRTFDGPVSAALPMAAGTLLVANDRDLVEMPVPGFDRRRVLHRLPPGGRANDGKADPRGRLWIGTVAAVDARGALYRCDSTPTPVLGDLGISNGLGWSPDGTRMYHADTPTRRIDVLDYDPGTGIATARRPFAAVDGMPDGLAVDTDGGVWVALFGGSALHRYTANGRLDHVVELPVSHPTSCAFVGEDLYVTSARSRLGGDERARRPDDGKLLRVRAQITGVPVSEVVL
ncbi:SMP-30/gluconolactonase/LRE family protein [Longispora sp. K20-0274]|uniref:SMP-30/gluconolactonase/LRE family protein n=1 Tax=Longispora sp. K20-0274 TaxID=3088255 RepID=UPI003999F0CC